MAEPKLLSSCETDYNTDRHSWIEIERQIRNLAEAGFTHTQWMHDWEGEYLYSKSEMFQARDILRDYGIQAHSIHASEGGRRTIYVDGRPVFRNRHRFTDIRKDYTSENEYTRLAGVELLKNRIDLCTCIGASVMVLHMQLPYAMFEEQPERKRVYYQQVFKSFDEVRDYAVAAGVRIALENLICTPQKYQEEEFDLMFDRYSDDFLGYAWDSGHATLMCREDPYHFLKKYHARLYATHLQDNASISDELLYQADPVAADREVLLHDSHWIPNVDGSLGRGMVDWNYVAKMLATAPLEMPPDLEVMISGDDEKGQLKTCRLEAEKLYQMILKYKQDR